MNRQIITRQLTAAASVVVGLVTIIPASSAAAQDQDAEIEAIVDTVETIASDKLANPAPGTIHTDNGTLTTAAETTVAINADPANPIKIIDKTGNQITLTAPDSLGLGLGASTDNGSTVYQGGETDLTITPTEEGGVQALININTPTAPNVYGFDLGLPNDAVFAKQPDGAILVSSSTGETIGRFNSPWAVDANGVAVPTSYNIQNGQLIQTVDHTSDDYAYPIIADPWWNPISWAKSAWGVVKHVPWSKVGKKLLGCAQGSAEFVGGFSGGQQAIVALSQKISGAGLKVVSTTPAGFWVMAGAGCVKGIITS